MSVPSSLVPGLLHSTPDASAPMARHLAGYSFRFDPSAPERPADLPATAADWTAAQTLGELRRRGARVDRSSRGLRLRHAHRLPQLAEAIAQHERLVSTWVDLNPAAPPHGWDEETGVLLRYVRGLEVPKAPLSLRPGVSVTDWERFLDSVEGRFEQGPAAPCAEGLRRDLRDVYGQPAQTEIRQIPVRRARAA